jgi:hypothetical protein
MGKSKKHGRDSEMAALVVGVAWYSPSQWKRLKEVSAEPEKLHPTYRKWVEAFERTMGELTERGLKTTKVRVDISELQKWCGHKKLRIDGEARSQYVLEWVQKNHAAQGAFSKEEAGPEPEGVRRV